MITVDQILPLVPKHLAAQRWYDGDGPPPRVEAADSATWLDGDPSLVWLLVDAMDGDRRLGRYQLVVGARPAGDEHAFLQGKTNELLGVVETDDGPVAVYDAFIDPPLALDVLGRIAPDVEASSVRPLAVEQSNTSVVYDEHVIVKLFRRIHAGENPDVDAVSRLEEVGFTHVPRQFGVLERPAPDDGAVQHLGVAREFLTGASDGWHLALASLRVVIADHLESAASGGDFGPDAQRLGAITGELHRRMAEVYGTSDAHVDAWVGSFRAQLDRVREHVPADEISRRYDRVAELRDPGPALRIHGDLHLGQTLRADSGWYVIDFEGEPARPMAERLAPSSPLRDVAGMLRSFHYAAEVARHEREDAEDVASLVADWQDRARTRFLEGYFATDGIDDILPDEASTQLLLQAFELDKAVYEVAYETAYRPSWVGIPLGAIRRLLA
ncbi:MAG: maltokinase N-terminal cap-like domain-containing protein [Acidimicrobiia bacterium]